MNNVTPNSYNRTRKSQLLMGSALAVLGVIAAGGAIAQTAPSVETVTVTGSNIRGAAPVGANVITMDAASIETTGAVTTQDLLTNIPSLSGFGNQGAGADARGGLGTADASGSSSPNIHSLGASSSSTTLILIDGHHVPLSGLSHTLVDPSIIAPDAISRVDVLPDGASAVYGSDAAAGVINIITKKKYNGLEFSAQGGVADAYNRSAFGVSFGHAWDDGGAMIAYDFSSNSHLLVTDRSYLSNNLVSRGGFNGASFNCAPATIAGTGTTGSTGTAAVYTAPYTSPSIGSSSVAVGAISSAPCDNSIYTAILPSEVRHNVFASFNQQFGTRINASFDFGFSDHIIRSPVSRGTVTAIAFGPGSGTTVAGQPLSAAGQAPAGAQTNPFYQSGTTGLTSSEGVRYDFNSLLGPGAYTKGGQLDTFVAGGIDINLFSDWVATVSGTAGIDWSSSRSRGTVNASDVNLALNGTTNVNGTAATSTSTSAQADQFGLGEYINATRVPLTTSNALDVWDPAASNKTSAAVLNQIKNNNPLGSVTQQDLNNLQIQADGTLFSLPAGDLKTVFGADYLMNDFNTAAVANSVLGAVETQATTFKANRTDWAQFIEFNIPVVSPEMNIPLVQKFTMDVAGRHDHYSTFGDTVNPKVSFSWQAVDGLKATGSYGTSFVAPSLTALPAAFAGSVAVNSSGTNQVILPNHANAPGSFCAAGCTLDAAHLGLTITGANNSNPVTALTYTFGVELDPGRFISALTGVRVQVTYWQDKSKGLITTPTLANEAQVPGLEAQLLLAPVGGWTPTSPAVLNAIAGIPLAGVLQPNIWFIYHNVQQNAFNILANGLDFDASYTFATDNNGDFNIDLSGSDKLRFDETPYPAGPSTRFLNGYNVNTTFSSLALTGRLTLGWHLDPVSVNFAINYVNPYFFQTSNAPFNLATPGVPAGFQHVHSSYPIDMHIGYELPHDWIDGTSVALTVNNILDQKPPFYDNLTGYDPNNASPLGRIAELSIRKKF